jgi:hypothetical protein
MEKLDPDPHFFGKLDPYPHYLDSWIRIRIELKSWIRFPIEVKKLGSLEAPWRAEDAHKWRRDGSKWSPGESVVDQWLQIRITLMRSRFRSGSALKVKSGIRILKK